VLRKLTAFGAGLGLHTVALAKRGFEVVAIDNCQSLLDELQARARSLTVAVHNADLLDFRSLLRDQAQVIVCMGDTLTHLPALPAVESLQYGDHHVTVHDLLHERADGRWRQTVSSYPKLRLAPEWVMSKLSELGLRVTRDATPSGMARIVATKN
jgi:predicted TPR repeat methyltransferase